VRGCQRAAGLDLSLERDHGATRDRRSSVERCAVWEKQQLRAGSQDRLRITEGFANKWGSSWLRHSSTTG